VIVAGVISKVVMVGMNAVQPSANIIDKSGIKSNFFIDLLPAEFKGIVAQKVLKSYKFSYENMKKL